MIELLLGAMASAAVLLSGKALVRRDGRVEAQLAGLAPPVAPRRPRRGILEAIGSRLPADRVGLSEALSAAGSEASVERLIGAGGLLSALGVAAGLGIGPLAVLVSPLLGYAGWKSPWWYLRSRADARRHEVARDLPDAVEMMAVCTRGGLNISLALERVGERFHGTLGDEIRRTSSAIALGEPRAQALTALAGRVELDEVDSLVGVLLGAERFGTKVASTLESLADDLRADRRRQAEERARKAPVKILFPLVLLILPAFILLTVVPLLLGTFQSLGF